MEEFLEHGNSPLLRDNFIAEIEPYEIRRPEIASGAAYYFMTGSGLQYEVLFAKKKSNYLENIINFSVLNDEFEDEYSETNRGEVYRIIATVLEIVRIYHEHHSYSLSYEFSGEYKGDEARTGASIRTRLYYRKALQVMHPSWDILLQENKVVVQRKKNYHE